ncbi:hypothetical protein Poli38472_014756 [Pythium oligandrum]|uniref:4Fe-4S ferredoxin-type domain-containing protein n=1 Tax=Pythium oligandrum TaxID=41045 RepID=A0A8K1C204_PYTOL|nr:hypothetical protein Poli38472_014756 [Pythium oligandrum]|eukprot:TMW54985.1 hypothetical protein Poli38472_014756 [Pythium oligandrum]
MADVWLALAPQLDDADNACVDLLCGDCENVAPSDMLRILLDVGIPVSSTSTRGEIPAVMQWLGRCNDTDVEKLRSRLEIPEGKSFYDAWNDLRAEQGTAVAEPGTPSTQMLTQIIKHSEFWFHPSVSWEKEKKWIQESSFGINQVQDYAWHCVLSGNTSDPSCTALKDYGKQLASPMDFSKITNTLPFLYQRDEYSNKYATIPEGASVLLMSGKLDFEFLPAGPMISLSI